jgi:DNA-binding CsgD family transcriptional regulator
MRKYDIALPALREGIAYGEAREFGSIAYLRAWLARCELELGQWDAAGASAGELLRNPRVAGISRFVALVTLGWLRGRRGDPDVQSLLDEALAMALDMTHLQRLWPVAACRAEIAWLAGDIEPEMELVEQASALAASLAYRPAIEELAHWRHVADGVACGSAVEARTPFGLSAAGRHDLAAARWTEMGCPYEAAMARFFTGSASEMRAAHSVFEAIGAAPMRARTATALRAVGARVPRGPRVTTRQNPNALTDRELDVLGLMTAGRTNREIADELGISVKTAGHHVSKVLAKLGARSRGEAAVAALRLGIVSSDQ